MSLLQEKRLTKTIIIPATQQEVWSKWTSKEGITSFFAPDCNIELRIGGPFEMYFLLNAEEGQRGSEGCTILSFLPYEFLSFTWNAPPQFAEIRNSGEHTWVIVSLIPMFNDRTFVKITHYGWKEGEDWNAVYDYFDKAWGRVLQNLRDCFFEAEPEDLGIGTRVNTLVAARIKTIEQPASKPVEKALVEEKIVKEKVIENEVVEEEMIHNEVIGEVEVKVEIIAEEEEETSEEQLESELEETFEEEVVDKMEEAVEEAPKPLGRKLGKLEIEENVLVKDLAQILGVTTKEVVSAGKQAGFFLSNREGLDGMKIASIMHFLGEDNYSILPLNDEEVIGEVEEEEIFEEMVEAEMTEEEAAEEEMMEEEEVVIVAEEEETTEEEPAEEEMEEEIEEERIAVETEKSNDLEQLKIQMGKTSVILVGQEEFGNLLVEYDSILVEQYEGEEKLEELLKDIESKNADQVVVIRANNFQELKEAYWNQNKLHVAAGGLVVNELGEFLLMFRRDKWDLPKGHAEKGETIEETAVREVSEETGLGEIRILAQIYPTGQVATYHTYRLKKGKRILKETFWYVMDCEGSPDFIPQVEEDIERIEWVSADDLKNYMDDTYSTVIDVINAGLSILPDLD